MGNIHISLQAETLGYVLGFPITNSLILSVITAFLLVGGGFFIARSMKSVPGKAQSTLELLIGGMLDFMAQVVGDRKQAAKFFPLVATIFLFILLNNWLGVLPGIGSIGLYHEQKVQIEEDVHGTPVHIDDVHEEELGGQHGGAVFTPLFRAGNADLNMTFALALIAVFAVQMYAVQRLGFFTQIGKYIDFKHGPIHFFVGLLEIVGEFARVLSFSFRLFGNVFAGEVLLIIVMALLPLAASFGALPFFLLEYFVGFIQALVFAMLTLVFLKVATMEVEH